MRRAFVHLLAILLGCLIFLMVCSIPVASQTTGTSEPRCAGMSWQTPVGLLESTGDTLRQRKAYVEALACYESALHKDKNSVILLNKAGIAELQMADLNGAQTYFQRAIKQDRKYAEAYNNLGVVAHMRRNYKEAVKRYQKALALREASASFHSNLGTAYFALKKMDKATAEYARALELDPDVLIRSYSGGVAAQISSPEERASYSYLLAKMYGKRGDIERCIHCLQRAKEDGYKKMHDVYVDPEFAAIRTDPRVAALVPPKAQ